MTNNKISPKYVDGEPVCSVCNEVGKINHPKCEEGCSVFPRGLHSITCTPALRCDRDAAREQLLEAAETERYLKKERDAALALAESLKCCGDCGHYQTPLRLGHPETCAFDGVMTCGNYGPCGNWQPRSNSMSEKIHCSFCGKDREKVKKLLCGPLVFICDECVESCSNILIDECDIKSKRFEQLKAENEVLKKHNQQLINQLSKHEKTLIEAK